MNVAFFLKPKSNVTYACSDDTMKVGLDKLRKSGYMAIPVISSDSKYAGTITEGDFLWHIIDNKPDDTVLADILMPKRNPPVPISASVEELLTRAMNQNFIPVIDDRQIFIGIVTRKDIIVYYAGLQSP